MTKVKREKKVENEQPIKKVNTINKKSRRQRKKDRAAKKKSNKVKKQISIKSEINNYNYNKENNKKVKSRSNTNKNAEIPFLIGLENPGTTCYMNATLQCFNHVERLRQALLREETYKILELNKKEDKKLSFAFAEVLQNLWLNKKKECYSPIYFKQVISEMNHLYDGYSANDSKDLILFLLENLHKELNIKKNIVQNNNDNFIPDPTNFYEIYNEFKKNYVNLNDSIISQEFYGYNNIKTQCTKCQTIIHNVQVYNIIFFPLEEIRKYKNYPINTQVKISDCFDYNQKINIYESFYCNFCNSRCKAQSQTLLIDAPKTLIINLNRGMGKQFNINIKLEESINIKPYIGNNSRIYNYELIGVLSHYGPNSTGGHFISFCKNSVNGNWYSYDDFEVDLSSFKEVCSRGIIIWKSKYNDL